MLDPSRDTLDDNAVRVGDALRKARIAQGHKINDIARQLRINSYYLISLEEGRPQDLPGPIYAYGFTRSYALALGLDPNQIAPCVQGRTVAAPQKSAQVVDVRPAPSRKVLALVTSTAGVVGVIGATALWWPASEPQQSAMQVLPPMPTQRQQTSGSELVSTPHPTDGFVVRITEPAPPAFDASPPTVVGVTSNPPPAPTEAEAPSTVSTSPPPGSTIAEVATAADGVPVPSASRPSVVIRDQVITLRGANVRADPDGSARVLRTVSGAVRLTVFAHAAGGWVQIGDADAWGWVHSSLLAASDPSRR
jgi:cytoskeleton protein RodZ